MGIYRRFVEGSSSIGDHKSSDDGLITVPNAMTLARPILAGIACRKLVTNEKGVSKWMLATGVSDSEGSVGRILDKLIPRARIGTSDIGAEMDPVADTMAMLEVSAGALYSKRVSPVAKLAILTVLGQELAKTEWALRRNREHQTATGERLAIKPTEEGRESMVEKMMAMGLAVSTHDIENPTLRHVVGAAALVHAVYGASRAEEQRRIYDQQAAVRINTARHQATV